MGPLVFALALHPIVDKIRRKVLRLRINVCYLNDGTLCCSAEDLCKPLTIIEEEGPLRGLRVNRSMSILFVPKNDTLGHNPILSDFPSVIEGFDLFGCTIRTSAYCAAPVLE